MPVGTLVQVTLPSSTNLPADDVVNTFAFATAGTPMTQAQLEELFESFYNEQNEGDHSIAEFIGLSISRSRDVLIKAYDLDDPEPRTPYAQGTIILAPESGDAPLPDEVALCLSFAAPPESGTPPARLRGRIFVGPFMANAIGTGTQDHPVPNVNLMNAMLAAAVRLQGLAGGAWSVWSRADNQVRPAGYAWVDNAWDSQRRRGRPPTSRVVSGLF